MTALTPTADNYAAASIPLRQVAAHSRRVADLCDLLEAIADDLPRRVAPVWDEVSRLCSTIIPNHYDDVSRVILPVLLRRLEGNADAVAVLRRLQADYLECCVRLPELNDLLADATGSSVSRARGDALGYALRHFFESLRRQIDWEKDVLLPMASRSLTVADLDEIMPRLSHRVSDA